MFFDKKEPEIEIANELLDEIKKILQPYVKEILVIGTGSKGADITELTVENPALVFLEGTSFNQPTFISILTAKLKNLLIKKLYDARNPSVVIFEINYNDLTRNKEIWAHCHLENKLNHDDIEFINQKLSEYQEKLKLLP